MVLFRGWQAGVGAVLCQAAGASALTAKYTALNGTAASWYYADCPCGTKRPRGILDTFIRVIT